MIAQTQDGKRLLVEPVSNLASVFILMPFDPKTSSKEDLEKRVKGILKKTELQLIQKFPRYTATRILSAIEALTETLFYSGSSKSIAIIVSSEYDKLYYLDFSTEEKIIVGKDIEVRNILQYKKPDRKYFLLVLSNKQAKIYFGNGDHLVRMVHNLPSHIAKYKNDIAEKVGNFSDPQHRKEVMIKKFIKHVDEGLSIIINAYHLPVILMCTNKTKGYFYSITKNTNSIVQFIHGNYDRHNSSQLIEKIQPFLNSWNQISDVDNLFRLRKAIEQHKASIGLNQVIEATHEKKGKLLLLEHGSVFPETNNNTLNNNISKANNQTFCRTTLNEIIQEVLENGGTVDLVSDNVLKDYGHIALINYY